MNKTLIAKRFAKAASVYDKEAVIQLSIAQRTAHLLQEVWQPTKAPEILEIGCGTGFLTQLLLEYFSPHRLWANDLCDTMEKHLPMNEEKKIFFLPGDAEEIAFPQQKDLIASCSTIQWFNNTASFFLKCHNSLTANGVIALSTFGPDNFIEIKKLLGQGLSYPDLEQLKEELSPYFKLHIAEEKKHTLLFNTPMNVLRHLKDTGVTGTGHYQWNRQKLNHFCDEYTKQFCTTNNKVTLTYHPIYLIGEKKN